MYKDLLMQQYNLHAAVHQPKETRIDKNINEFKSTGGLGYYEVTVLGEYLVAWHLKMINQEQNKILVVSCVKNDLEVGQKLSGFPWLKPLNVWVFKFKKNNN